MNHSDIERMRTGTDTAWVMPRVRDFLAKSRWREALILAYQYRFTEPTVWDTAQNHVLNRKIEYDDSRILQEKPNDIILEVMFVYGGLYAITTGSIVKDLILWGSDISTTHRLLRNNPDEIRQSLSAHPDGSYLLDFYLATQASKEPDDWNQYVKRKLGLLVTPVSTDYQIIASRSDTRPSLILMRCHCVFEEAVVI